MWTKIKNMDEILDEIGDCGWTINVILDNIFLECLLLRSLVQVLVLVVVVVVVVVVDVKNIILQIKKHKKHVFSLL